MIDFDLISFLVLNATFSYIMATSFSGGRSRSTRREPPTMDKQLVSFITCGCELNTPTFAIYKAGSFLFYVLSLHCSSEQKSFMC